MSEDDARALARCMCKATPPLSEEEAKRLEDEVVAIFKNIEAWPEAHEE